MVYRDALGRPDAKATISMFGGVCSPAYYSLAHVNDCPDHIWSGDTPVETIVAEMVNDGWHCNIRRDGFNKPVIECVHVDTQNVIDAVKAADSAKFANAERCYIRFGTPPKGGHSYNHRDNCLEAGISCFDAEITADGAFRLLLTPVLEVSYLTVADRPAYRLYGERIGTGADGEPVLCVERAIKL